MLGVVAAHLVLVLLVPLVVVIIVFVLVFVLLVLVLIILVLVLIILVFILVLLVLVLFLILILVVLVLLVLVLLLVLQQFLAEGKVIASLIVARIASQGILIAADGLGVVTFTYFAATLVGNGVEWEPMALSLSISS